MQSLLGGLRDETLALQKSREDTQAELEAMARPWNNTGSNGPRTWPGPGQSGRDGTAPAGVDLAEQAAQRRVADLDDLEVRLREEFEEQERRLADQRRDVAAMVARLRQARPEQGRLMRDEGPAPSCLLAAGAGGL